MSIHDWRCRRTSAGLDKERRFWERASKGTSVPESPSRGSVVGPVAISSFRPRSRAPCILENPGRSFFGILGFQIGVSYVNNQGDSQKTAFKATIFLIQHLIFMHITAVLLIHFIAHVYLK